MGVEKERWTDVEENEGQACGSEREAKPVCKAEVAWHGQTYNSLQKWIPYAYGSVVEPIQNVICRTKAVPVSHSHMFHVIDSLRSADWNKHLRSSDWLCIYPVVCGSGFVYAFRHFPMKWNVYIKAQEKFSVMNCKLVWVCQQCCSIMAQCVFDITVCEESFISFMQCFKFIQQYE